MDTWPLDLPQQPLLQGYKNDLIDTVIWSDMQQGDPKSRRAYPGDPRMVTFTLVLTNAQRESLLFFYLTVLSRVLPFEWIDHTTGDYRRYRFTAPPAFSALGNGLWSVEINLRTSP